MALPRDPVHRRAALRWGLHAERLAGLFLLLKGYTVLDRRYSGGGGEIDLIARRGRLVVFAEVKARADLASAAVAVDATKRRRILRAVAHWRARHPWAEGHDLRCDIVLVAPWRWPCHLADAFPIEW